MTRQDNETFCAAKWNKNLPLSVSNFTLRAPATIFKCNEMSLENGGKTKERLEWKMKFWDVFTKQRSFPNIPPSWGRLGLEVQHHTALRGPHNHSPRRRRNFWPATRDAFSPTGSTKAFDFKLMQWWKNFSQPPLPKQIRQKLLLPSLSSMELVCPSKRTLGLANSLPLHYEVRRGDWLKVV